MLWSLAIAAAGPGHVLVGVDALPWRPPVGRVEQCFLSSRVCVVEGTTPAALRGTPGVRHAAWDRPAQLPQAGPIVAPTPQCPDPYELDAIDVQTAWATGWGLLAPMVAVQDAGFRFTHLDLEGRIGWTYDYGSDDPIPEVSPAAVPGHGTFVAGIIAANADDAGRTGVAPGASLFLQKIADEQGALYFSYAIAAMDDLVMNHPEVGVLNYSIAAVDPPQAFDDAVLALGTADIVLVTAAANCPTPDCPNADNDQHPVYPNNYPYDHIVGVASLRPDGTLDPYSHYGASSVAMAAPGADLCSLDVGSDTDTAVASGTSYAAPVVAGVAALVREAYPGLTAAEVVEALCQGAEPSDAEVACGALNAPGALSLPFVDLLDVPDVVLDGPTPWTFTVDSRGAAHEAELTLDLPDFVEVVPPSTLDLPADDVHTESILLQATEAGDAEAELVLTLPDGTVHRASFRVQATVEFEPIDTSVTHDTADTGTAPTQGTVDPPTSPPAEEAPSGCSCSTPVAPGWWPARRR